MDNDTKTVLLISAIVNKNHVSELQEYLGKVMQVFGKNGGKPVGRFKTTGHLLGDDSPEMTAIIEFPNAQVIQELVDGEEFLALSDLRARVFTKLNMDIAAMM